MMKLVRGAVILLFVAYCNAFYLPGLAPVHYCTKGAVTDSCQEGIKIFVNRLNSAESVIPYEYNHFDFCLASIDGSPVENLGQVVFGERIRPSPYVLEFKKDEKNRFACEVKKYLKSNADDMKKLDKLRQAIKLNYQHHWQADHQPGVKSKKSDFKKGARVRRVPGCFSKRVGLLDEGWSQCNYAIAKKIVDNMPMTFCYQVEGTTQNYCAPGFPVGCYINKDSKGKDGCETLFGAAAIPNTYFLYNHVDIFIEYHPKEADWNTALPEGAARLVKAKVQLRSIKHVEGKQGDDAFATQAYLAIPSTSADLEIRYSYSVTFSENKEIKWSSRWDYILESMGAANIQWFSIINSVVIVLFLSGMVAMILLRTLHRDIARYNQADMSEDAQEEFGWKLVHGDVFRAPKKGMFLAVLLGSGVQIFFMSLITLVFACLGFLSPANRGALMTCSLVLYVCLGTPAGYVSARIYKMFGGEKWKSNVIFTAFLCPGIVFAVFFILNIILWIMGSSGAIPFLTLVAVLSLWFGISVPLTFVGAYFGFKKPPIEHPVRTNQIPRQVPDQSFYTKALPGIAMGGVLPFGCIFIQLFFILNSIWSHQMYYMFGFLFLIFIILLITCSQATVLLCYFHLCAEDYNWWWRSFLSSASTAVYFFCYSIHYYLTKLEIEGFVSTFLYFGYTFIMAFLFFLLTGTIGFFACFWFVTKIYSVIKVD